jgi:hypothetical protein
MAADEGDGEEQGMRRGFALAGLTAAFFVALAPVLGAGAATQTRTCPLPVVGGDPDTVTLNGPVGTTWSVTADESPGEASHLVSITVQISASDGSGPLLRTSTGLGFSPVSVPFTLAPGHHYAVQWLATFDFGPHLCTSLLPGEAPFQIDT